MSGTSDKIAGAANEAIGKVKQGIAGIVGSEDLKAKGAAQEQKGQAQTAEGQGKDGASETSGGRERRIRDRAYQIWEREGLPEGRDHDHWRQAESEIDAEDLAQ